MYCLGSYIPLWCLSHFSFLEGASHPEELVEEAHRMGLRAIAITDRDGVYGMVKAHMKALELGIQLIAGAQMTLAGGGCVVLLVKDEAGWKNLCTLISKGRLAAPKGHCASSLSSVCAHSEGLIALLPDTAFAAEEPLRRALASLHLAFQKDCFALITRHQEPADRPRNHRMCRLAQEEGVPVAATTRVLYHTKARRPLQDVLTCIRHGVTLSGAAPFTHQNDEHHLHAPASFAMCFADLPQAVAMTGAIASRCRFSLGALRYRYPSETGDDGVSSSQRLRQLTFEGAAARYGGAIPDRIARQLETELALIDELNYPGYFLTMYEVVQFCRQQNILCQGRGSAANSAVCYCLGITAVDPMQMDLLFERFISRERAEPPDIDLDIEHRRREEVIAFIYQRYGRSHAAMVAVVVRYRPRSAVRDAGRALGVGEAALARLSKLLSRWGAVEADAFVSAGLSPDVPLYGHLLQMASLLVDVPRHLSIHPGGFLLGSEPVHHLVPVENGAMPGRTVIQWDKDDVEAMGLFKVDLLALGALTHLHLCFDLLKETRGLAVDLASIPADDADTWELISRGDTVGVFQIESRAQMAMLPRLRPRHFYDLVIEVSIVRPGPITGGMVHPYLRRRRGEEEVTFPHPCLEPILKKTLGVPLFQEQVMRVAMAAADYTPGEADQLRRDMAAWKKSGRIDRHRETLISRMVKKGISAEFAQRVFEQIRGFGEYGFPESHAASFALISYASAWLRAHFPAEFTCALLNALPMGFYMPSTIVEDARRKGVHIHPVDVAKSDWFCTVPQENSIRMGLRHVNGLGPADWERIRNARGTHPFAGVDDFAHRTGLDRRGLAALSGAGAFSGLDDNRRTSLWKAIGTPSDQSLALPSDTPEVPFFELDFFEAVTWDYEATGHSVRGHPMEALRPGLLRLPTAARLRDLRDGAKADYAGMVICRQRPSTASGVVFMTLEDETGFVNLVCWKDVYETHRVLAKTAAFLGVTGTVQKKDGVTHLIAQKLWKPAFDRPSAAAKSRDFR